MQELGKPGGLTRSGVVRHEIEDVGLQFGVLVAMNRTTGQQHALTAAQNIVAAALQEQRELIALSQTDLRRLGSPRDLIGLLQDRRLQLSVTRGLPSGGN